MACQTDGAWIWLELAGTESGDIKVHYAARRDLGEAVRNLPKLK